VRHTDDTDDAEKKQCNLLMMLLVSKTTVRLTNDVDDAKNESIGTEEGQVGSISVAINRL